MGLWYLNPSDVPKECSSQRKPEAQDVCPAGLKAAAPEFKALQGLRAEPCGRESLDETGGKEPVR